MSAKQKDSSATVPNERQREIDRLEKDVDDLRHMAGDVDADAELERIRQQVSELRREFYTHLGPWQRAQIARHPQRPYTQDFIGFFLLSLLSFMATALLGTIRPLWPDSQNFTDDQ